MDAKPKLLHRTSELLRALHYSYRSEQAYLGWIRRYIRFHGRRRPETLGAPELEVFLTHLAVDRKVSAATQNQALAAVLFLYKRVLGIERPWLDSVVRAKASRRLPVVLSVNEVRRTLRQLDGEHLRVAQLLYGSGLRLMEALRLRVKDLDFEYSQIVVRDGKGAKDGVTVLPSSLHRALQLHLGKVRTLQELLGRAHVSTTQIYTHVMHRGAGVVLSPLDV